VVVQRQHRHGLPEKDLAVAEDGVSGLDGKKFFER
jgi:hypothetical protein